MGMFQMVVASMETKCRSFDVGLAESSTKGVSIAIGQGDGEGSIVCYTGYVSLSPKI